MCITEIRKAAPILQWSQYLSCRAIAPYIGRLEWHDPIYEVRDSSHLIRSQVVMVKKGWKKRERGTDRAYIQFNDPTVNE